MVIVIGVFLSLAGPPLYAGLLPSDQRHLRNGIYQDYNAINEGPSALHWFGADYLGRDVLTRLLTAIRVSLTVALVVEAINIGVGGTLGLIAGYFGGVADVLFGDKPFTGKLPYTWPRSNDQLPFDFKNLGTGDQGPLFPFGYGLTK